MSPWHPITFFSLCEHFVLARGVCYPYVNNIDRNKGDTEMEYAAHQANAYKTPEQLDEAIIDRAGGFLRCTWKGGAIDKVVDNIASDVTTSGRFEFADRGENWVLVEDTETNIEYRISANGHVR